MNDLMTREEAIKNIKTYAIYDEDIPAQVAKALDMAIAALREQEQHRWIPVRRHNNE